MWHLLSLPIGHLRCSLLSCNNSCTQGGFLTKPILKVRVFSLLVKALMIAHFYDMFAVRKFVPTIPFLRPVLVSLLSMTITINNSNYKLTKKKKVYRTPPSRIVSG